MPPNTSMRSGRPCEQQEADCPPSGWTECCTGSNTRGQTGCSSTWPGWPLAIPVQLCRRNWPICRSVKRTCGTRPIRQQAGRLVRGVSKAPTRWSSRHASKGLACVGVGRTSTPCWCCATRSATGNGTRPGRRQWPIDESFAQVSDKQTVSSDWPAPFGSSSSGEYGCIGCPIHLFLFPPHRRLRPSRSNQFVVLVLAIPGANPFSDVLLPPLRFQKRRVQKNETHPGAKIFGFLQKRRHVRASHSHHRQEH